MGFKIKDIFDPSSLGPSSRSDVSKRNILFEFVLKVFSDSRDFIKEHYLGVAFVGIILIAIFFRFYKLDAIPPGVSTNEADIGNLAYKIESQGYSFSDNLSVVLFPSLGILFFKIFGLEILSLRFLSFTAGVLTVVLLYVFTKEWFNIKVALLSSFLLSISSWHVTLSRNVGFEVLIPFILLLIFVIFTLALRTQKKIYFFLSALVLGAGFYASSFFIVFPLILLAFALALFVFRRQLIISMFKKFWPSVVLLFLAALPAIIYLGRGLSKVKMESGLQILKNGFNTLLLFNLKGDLNFAHNLGTEPLLDPTIGIAFVLGVVYIAFRVGKLKSHLKNLFLLLWLLLGLLPAIFGPRVDSSKVVFMLPVAYIFAAISMIFILERWLKTFPLNKPVRTGIVGIFILALVLSTSFSYKRYLVAYARSPETYKAFNEEIVAIDSYLKSVPKSSKKLAFVDNKKLPILQFLSYNSYVTLKPTDLEKLEVSGETIFVFDNTSLKTLELVKRKFPQGIYGFYPSELTKQIIFSSYLVKK